MEEDNSQSQGESPQNSQESENGIDEKDIFRIFISTDNHLGYKENDSIRGDDSFVAFDEVLSM
jgi:double-strand break repair protein MRE11